jgi:hypothetical protein
MKLLVGALQRAAEHFLSFFFDFFPLLLYSIRFAPF